MYPCTEECLMCTYALAIRISVHLLDSDGIDRFGSAIQSKHFNYNVIASVGNLWWDFWPIPAFAIPATFYATTTTVMMSQVSGWNLKRARTYRSCVESVLVLVSGTGAQQQLQQQQNNIFSGPRHTHWLNRASGRNDYWGHIQMVVQDSDHRYWRCILWGTTCRLTRRVFILLLLLPSAISTFLCLFGRFFLVYLFFCNYHFLHKHDTLSRLVQLLSYCFLECAAGSSDGLFGRTCTYFNRN